jgi:hypothetical protein
MAAAAVANQHLGVLVAVSFAVVTWYMDTRNMDTRNMGTWNMATRNMGTRIMDTWNMDTRNIDPALCTANASHTHVTARAPTLHVPLPQMDPRAPANKTATNTPSEQGGGDHVAMYHV